jgi:hypothetical protein
LSRRCLSSVDVDRSDGGGMIFMNSRTASDNNMDNEVIEEVELKTL